MYLGERAHASLCEALETTMEKKKMPLSGRALLECFRRGLKSPQGGGCRRDEDAAQRRNVREAAAVGAKGLRWALL